MMHNDSTIGFLNCLTIPCKFLDIYIKMIIKQYQSMHPDIPSLHHSTTITLIRKWKRGEEEETGLPHLHSSGSLERTGTGVQTGTIQLQTWVMSTQGECVQVHNTHTHKRWDGNTRVVFILLFSWCGAGKSHCRSLQVHPELRQPLYIYQNSKTEPESVGLESEKHF